LSSLLLLVFSLVHRTYPITQQWNTLAAFLH
jgi:hypothetical protein